MTKDDTSPKTRAAFDWGRWIAAYAALAFVMLGVDAAMSHHDVIHETRLSWIPLLFAPLALLTCVAGVFSARVRRSLWLLGLLALLVGGTGTFFHVAPTITERGRATLWHALLASERPIFAPASFAGMGLLLLLAAWGERRP